MPNLSQDAREAGLVSGVSLNHASPFNPQDYNEFDRSADMFETQRFAEINPIYAQEFNGDDIIPIRSLHELRSFTLKSPLMSDLYMNRAFFQVPLQAIYPHTFQPLFKPEIKGSDIPDGAKAAFNLALIKGGAVSLSSLVQSVYTSGFNTYVTSTVFFKCLLLFIQLFSRDSLLVKLGYGLPDYGADQVFELILTNNTSQGIVVSYSTPSNPSKSITFKDTNVDAFHRYALMQLLYGKWAIISVTMEDPSTTQSHDLAAIGDIISRDLPSWTNDDFINLEKVFAYQLTCAKFYSNPYVDDINTSYRWLLNNETLAYSIVSNTQRSFVLNGVNYQYDLISRNILSNLMLIAFNYTSGTAANKIIVLNIFSNIFEVHSSLRYTDYFVDSRTQPITMDNTYAAVTGQGVSALDVNKSLWLQRFKNAVGRVPDNMRSYFRSIFGYEPDTIEAEPFIISKERFLIIGQEVENTNDTEQGKVVTNLRSSQSNFIFDVHVKEPVIIIGLNSYSVKYAYGRAVDKGFIINDRLDKFNPFLQHIGDQTVLYNELNNDRRSAYYGNTFGYQVRYAQFKTALSHATGGFLDDNTLQSWIALFDKTNAMDYAVMNTEFIRNQNLDFDQFYSSLTGTKMTTYFHFICRFTTFCDVKSRQQKFPSLM